jgi:D-glycero-D-manno-heptose 1,7-bisphosphate phosphatase
VSGAPAVFVDRDGTLIRERNEPPRRAGDVELLPGGAEALAQLGRAGFRVVMVTNQSAFARGWLRFEEHLEVQRALTAELARAGARLDALYFCPHHPSAGDAPYRRECACRKPRSGLLELAERELGLDLARSWMIGDALRDLQAGELVGVRGILVATGKGAREAAKLSDERRARTTLAADLAEAARLVLAQARQR